MAWSFTNGPIPDGMFVCHRCDNRQCCNPAHLFLGTNSDNVRDMKIKGRSIGRKTEHSGVRKLTPEDVRLARQLWHSGTHSHSKLAAMFGVRRSTIFGAVHKKTYSYVT